MSGNNCGSEYIFGYLWFILWTTDINKKNRLNWATCLCIVLATYVNLQWRCLRSLVATFNMITNLVANKKNSGSLVHRTKQLFVLCENGLHSYRISIWWSNYGMWWKARFKTWINKKLISKNWWYSNNMMDLNFQSLLPEHRRINARTEAVIKRKVGPFQHINLANSLAISKSAFFGCC